MKIEYKLDIINKIVAIINECGIKEYYIALFEDIFGDDPLTGIFATIGAENYEIKHFLEQLEEGDYYIDKEYKDAYKEDIKIPKDEKVLDKYMNYFAIRLNQLNVYNIQIKNREFQLMVDKEKIVDQETRVSAGIMTLVNIMANDYNIFNIIYNKVTNMTSDNNLANEYVNGLITLLINAYIGKIMAQANQVSINMIMEFSIKSNLLKEFANSIKNFTDEEILYCIENKDDINPFKDMKTDK